MNIPEIQSIVDKLAHKKFFVALAFLYGVLRGDVTTYKLIAATVVTLAVIVCQTYLDVRRQNATQITNYADYVPEPEPIELPSEPEE